MSPDLEVTTSGRRVRIAGTTLSTGSKQVETLIQNAIDEVAKDRGTQRWMRVFPDDEINEVMANRVGQTKESLFNVAKVHYNDPANANTYHTNTLLVWHLKSKDAPITGFLTLNLMQRNSRMDIIPSLVWRSTNPKDGHSIGAVNSWHNNYLNIGEGMSRWSEEFKKTEDLFREHIGIDISTYQYSNQMRAAINKFLGMAKDINNREHLTVFQMDQDDKPSTFDMEIVATNFTASVQRELLDYVQTGPLLDRIKTSYEDLVTSLNALGITYQSRPGDNEFGRAISGDLSALRLTLGAIEDTEQETSGIDHGHNVVLDFATGSLIVNCSHKNDQSEISEAWEIARFKASLTGEEDILLEYAKAYRNPKEQARLMRIIKQRVLPDIEG